MKISISNSGQKVTVKQMRDKVKKALDVRTEMANSLEGVKSNPSAAPQYYMAVGIVDALETVLKALDGRSYELDQMSKRL